MISTYDFHFYTFFLLLWNEVFAYKQHILWGDAQDVSLPDFHFKQLACCNIYGNCTVPEGV